MAELYGLSRRWPAPADDRPLMACDAAEDYDLERLGRDRYRLTVPVPGCEAPEVEVEAEGPWLRVICAESRDSDGVALHRGLRAASSRTFLMLRPLAVTRVEVRAGLVRIELCAGPDGGVRADRPPRLVGVEALAA